MTAAAMPARPMWSSARPAGFVPPSTSTTLGAGPGLHHPGRRHLDDQAGCSVSSAGDVNGDGFDDLIVGAPYGDDGGSDAGEAYVVFGKAGGLRHHRSRAACRGRSRLHHPGRCAGDQAGCSVSAAGDVNGDGFDDLIVGAPFGDDGGDDAGEAYVVFGKASGFATIDLDAHWLPTAAASSSRAMRPIDQCGHRASPRRATSTATASTT